LMRLQARRCRPNGMRRAVGAAAWPMRNHRTPRGRIAVRRCLCRQRSDGLSRFDDRIHDRIDDSVDCASCAGIAGAPGTASAARFAGSAQCGASVHIPRWSRSLAYTQRYDPGIPTPDRMATSPIPTLIPSQIEPDGGDACIRLNGSVCSRGMIASALEIDSRRARGKGSSQSEQSARRESDIGGATRC